MKPYNYADRAFTFEGAISVQTDDEGVRPWRVDCNRLDFYPVLTNEVARDCSGVRLCFTTDTVNLSLNLLETVADQKMDLVVDGGLWQQVALEQPTASCRVDFKPLPEGTKEVEIWLDQRFPFYLQNVMVDDAAQIHQTVIAQKRWIHYGSSISQSKAGASPTQIWVAMVARRFNLHLTNLGFSGECKIESMIGRLIRDNPADYITLKLGINVHGGDLTRRTFAPNIIGLIQIIREKHPDTPLRVISPIYSRLRETTPGEEGGLPLVEMRQIISDIVASCQKYGDQRIEYVDGLQIFGSEEAARYMPDELHPDAAGQLVMAEKFSEAVFKKLINIC